MKMKFDNDIDNDCTISESESEIDQTNIFK